MVDNFLMLENRRNGETLRMHRRRDAEGRIVLYLDGTLPPKTDGPPLHMHVREREDGVVKAGTLGARVGPARPSRALVRRLWKPRPRAVLHAMRIRMAKLPQD
jgi:hypothetical protein